VSAGRGVTVSRGCVGSRGVALSRARRARAERCRARALARWPLGVGECLTYLPLRSDTKLKLPYYAKIVRHGMAYCCLQAPAPGSSTSSFGSCPARHTGICLEVAGAQGRRGAGAQGRRGPECGEGAE